MHHELKYQESRVFDTHECNCFPTVVIAGNYLVPFVQAVHCISLKTSNSSDLMLYKYFIFNPFKTDMSKVRPRGQSWHEGKFYAACSFCLNM